MRQEPEIERDPEIETVQERDRKKKETVERNIRPKDERVEM